MGDKQEISNLYIDTNNCLRLTISKISFYVNGVKIDDIWGMDFLVTYFND